MNAAEGLPDRARRHWGGRKTALRGRRILAAVALLGSALVMQVGAAQTASRGPGRAVIDRNADGLLDEQELREARREAFGAADKDGDGYLTGTESTAVAGDVESKARGIGILRRRLGGAETAAERFARLDADGDGRISEQEFVAAPHPLLRYDADGDGRLTREELDRGRERLREAVRRGQVAL